MSLYLLALALGPVQDFIAAGRRTADLQAGSRLLVLLAQAAAKSLKASGATLIFPADIGDPGAPNKLLALLPEGGDSPEAVAAAAESATRSRLIEERERAWSVMRDAQRAAIERLTFDAQIDGFLEFYEAWLPLKSEEDYNEARIELDRLLAARKALRAFGPSQGQEGVPKSPLNPAYETVLKQSARKRDDTVAAASLEGTPVFLKGGELLDGISLMKRVNGHYSAAFEDPKRVPSSAEMAMRLLYPTMREKAPEAFKELEAIVDRHHLYPEYDFGDLFFPGRVDEELEKRLTTQGDPSVFRKIRDLREELLQSSGRRVAPSYFALLLADGDRMGELLSSAKSHSKHIEFSSTLQKFGARAKEIFRGHGGHPAYIGGDDVFGYVPLNRAIQCAADLQEAFTKALLEIGLKGTLSAGIAVAHYLEPLQRGLDKMRTAEKAAKNDAGRDALAVALHPRGGEPITHAAQWDGGANVAAWTLWTEAFQGGVARGLPFEIEALEVALRGPKGHDPIQLPGEVLTQELIRLIGRKDGGKRFLNDNPNALDGVTDVESLKRLGQRLRIARFLARPEGERG